MNVGGVLPTADAVAGSHFPFSVAWIIPSSSLGGAQKPAWLRVYLLLSVSPICTLHDVVTAIVSALRELDRVRSRTSNKARGSYG